MNFLLTGATGFIGSRLIQRLLERGHFVSIFTRHVRSRDDRNVGQYYWNMQGPAPAEPFDNVDVVIHLAGEPIAQRWAEEAKRKIRESRTLGTRHLIEGLGSLRKRPTTLISGSAIGYYGDRGDEVLAESSQPGGDFLAGVCQEWEREAERAVPLGLRVVKIRTGLVLGSDGGALKRMLLPFKLGIGGVVGSGQQWMSWIHLDDLVNLIIFAVENPEVSGPINGVASNAVTNAEFTKALAKTLHRPAILPVPVFALKLLFGEMSEVLLGGQHVVPAAAQHAGFQFQHPEISEALRSLNL